MGDFSIFAPVSLFIFGSFILSLIAFLFLLRTKSNISKSLIETACLHLFEFISLYASSVIMPIFSFWDNAKSKEQSTAFDQSSYVQRSPLASRSLNQFSPATKRYSFNQSTTFKSPLRDDANSTLSHRRQGSDFLPPVRRISSLNRSHFSSASPLSSPDVTAADENLNTSYQLRYRVGQLPITRIKSPSHPRLTRENVVKSTVRIAPPDQFKPALPSIKRVNSSQDNIPPAVPMFNPCSTTSVLSSIREKRKINKLTDEPEFNSEEGPTKRRQIITDENRTGEPSRTGEPGRTGEPSREPATQSHKRPASTDLEKDPEFCEAASKKYRPEDDSDSDNSSLEERDQGDLSSSLSGCVRNPVDVSLSSSRMWLQRMMEQSENQSVGSSRSSSPVSLADLKPTSISPSDKQVAHHSNRTSDTDTNNVHSNSEPLTRSDSVNTDDTSSHSNFSAEIDNLSTYPNPSTSRDTSARSTPRQAFLLKSFADSCTEKESVKENPKISVNQNLKSKLRHTQIMNTLRDSNAVQMGGLSSAHQSTVTLEEFEADRSADLERVNEILSSITQTENSNSVLEKTKENISNNSEVNFTSTAFTPSSKQSGVPVSSVISSQNTTTTSFKVTNNDTSSHSATLQVPSFSKSFTATSAADVAPSSVLTSAVLAPTSVKQASSFALSSSTFSSSQSIPTSSLSLSSSPTNSLPAATLIQSTLPGTPTASTQILIKSEPSTTTSQFGLPNKEASSTLVKSTSVLTSGFNSPFAQAVTTCSVLTQPAGFSSNSQQSSSSVTFSSASFSFGSQAVQSTINNTGSQLQQTAGFSLAPSTPIKPASQLQPSVGFSLTPSTSQTTAPQLKPSVGFSLTPGTAQTSTPQVQPSVGFSLTPGTAQTSTPQVQPSVGFSLTPGTAQTNTPQVQPSVGFSLTSNTSQLPAVSSFQFDTKPANNNPPATQQSFNNFNNSSSIGAKSFTFGSTPSVNPSPLSMANTSNSSTQSLVGSNFSNTATSSSAQQNVFSQGAASVFGKFSSSTASAMSEQPKPFFQQVTPQETAKPASPFLFGQQSHTTSNVASTPNPFSTPVKTNQMNAFGDGKNISNNSQPLTNASSFNFTATPAFGAPPVSSVSSTPFGIANTTSSNSFQPAFSSSSFGGPTTQFSASTAATLGTSNFNFGQATPNFGDAANVPRPTPTFNIGAGSSTSSRNSYRARRRGGRR